jgi:hypothetical protein
MIALDERHDPGAAALRTTLTAAVWNSLLSTERRYLLLRNAGNKNMAMANAYDEVEDQYRSLVRARVEALPISLRGLKATAGWTAVASIALSALAYISHDTFAIAAVLSVAAGALIAQSIVSRITLRFIARALGERAGPDAARTTADGSIEYLTSVSSAGLGTYSANFADSMIAKAGRVPHPI